MNLPLPRSCSEHVAFLFYSGVSFVFPVWGEHLLNQIDNNRGAVIDMGQDASSIQMLRSSVLGMLPGGRGRKSQVGRLDDRLGGFLVVQPISSCCSPFCLSLPICFPFVFSQFILLCLPSQAWCYLVPFQFWTCLHINLDNAPVVSLILPSAADPNDPICAMHWSVYIQRRVGEKAHWCILPLTLVKVNSSIGKLISGKPRDLCDGPSEL